MVPKYASTSGISSSRLLRYRSLKQPVTYTLSNFPFRFNSTGQNALEQAKHFTAATDVSALAITKLDGTAKGGVVLAIANQFRIPVKFIGVGEKMEDLLVFDKHEFVDSLFSLENKS